MTPSGCLSVSIPNEELHLHNQQPVSVRYEPTGSSFVGPFVIRAFLQYGADEGIRSRGGAGKKRGC